MEFKILLKSWSKFKITKSMEGTIFSGRGRFSSAFQNSRQEEDICVTSRQVKTMPRSRCSTLAEEKKEQFITRAK